MKLNLLATTAVAALLASGGMWAQAQAPGNKQDENAKVHEQKAAPRKQEPLAAKQQHEPLAAKENHGEENKLRTKDTAAEPAKPAAQHAEDAQPKAKEARDQMNAKKDEAPKPAEQAQSKQSKAAAKNQNAEPRANDRDRHNAASNMHRAKDQAAKDKDGKDKAQAAKESTQDASKAAEQRAGEKAAPPKQQADKSKGPEKPTNSAAESKSGPSANQQATSTRSKTDSTNTASAKLSETDRTKVFSNLKSDRRASNQHIDIQVNVGQRLPPRVHPRALPRTVIDVLPQYRGYEYVMVRDEIAIVRPGTREVVDVIREPGSSFAERTATESPGTIHLTDQQRTRLREEARRFTTSQVSSAGSQCLTLQPVPSSLAAENPDLRQYQMLAIGDDLVLVDPNQKKVVDVIH